MLRKSNVGAALFDTAIYVLIIARKPFLGAKRKHNQAGRHRLF
jgi:hypothetical protein